MKYIKLTQNKKAIVDDDQYDELNIHKWHYHRGYAVGIFNRKHIFMHRIILNTPIGKYTDHINGNSLDNRKENLRICTYSDNNRNRGMARNNTSGLKGVTWHKYDKKWQAQIWFNNRAIYLGKYSDKFEAVNIYNAKAKELFGEYVRQSYI